MALADTAMPHHVGAVLDSGKTLGGIGSGAYVCVTPVIDTSGKCGRVSWLNSFVARSSRLLEVGRPVCIELSASDVLFYKYELISHGLQFVRDTCMQSYRAFGLRPRTWGAGNEQSRSDEAR